MDRLTAFRCGALRNIRVAKGVTATLCARSGFDEHFGFANNNFQADA
jgi:hypothetical protein